MSIGDFPEKWSQAMLVGTMLVGRLGVCVCVCINMYMYVCVYVCMHACMYVCMYVCMHACMHACMHVCMYVCMYVCIYIYIYICTYIILGKTDSIHHHHLKGNFETATVPELRQKPLYTTPSGWWWCIESVFRVIYK